MKKVRFYENERLDIVDAKALAELPFSYTQQTSHALGLGYANGIIPDVIHQRQDRSRGPSDFSYYNAVTGQWEQYSDESGGTAGAIAPFIGNPDFEVPCLL